MTTPPNRPAGLMPLGSAEEQATLGAGRLDEPMLCWTQLLRETELEVVGHSKQLPRLEDNSSLEKLFS